MEQFTAHLNLPTTIQEYRFECPQFKTRHCYILDDWNAQVYMRRLSRIESAPLRYQAKALFDLFTQSGAIIWTLMELPLSEYGLTVEDAIKKLKTAEYRKCALHLWKEWGSYSDIRTRILGVQVLPKGFELDEKMTKEDADKWCKMFGLTCWGEWTPTTREDVYGRTLIR